MGDSVRSNFPWFKLGGDIEGKAENDYFGYSVSLNKAGTIVAIGATYKDDVNPDEVNSNAGQVSVLKYNGTNWEQLGDIIYGEENNDNLGYSVSLNDNGTILAIGAIFAGDDNQGHVQVYQYKTDLNGKLNWVQMGDDIEGEVQYDYSGSSLSLSGDGTIVAIGAERNDGGGSNSGHVRVFKYGETGWNQLGLDIDGEDEYDYSGKNKSVSLSEDGTIVAIGAIYNDGGGSNSGHVRVFKYGETGWNQLGLDIDGEDEYDYSGSSVSLSEDGKIVAIGAYGNDGGNVRVFKYNGTAWIKLGRDIDGTQAGDYLGSSVSLSGDGKIVAVGAYLADSGAGHVGIYEWDGKEWLQIGKKIVGESADDYSGWSVSLSGDGKIVAIGAYGNDGAASNAGHVSVFKNVTLATACFTEDAIIKTDQGLIEIKNINTKHTIDNKEIKGVSKTIYTQDKIVTLEKDALGENKPNKKILVAPFHRFLINGKLKTALELVNNENIYLTKYKQQTLYNIILETQETMEVNNIVAETLDPDTLVAKLFDGSCSIKQRIKIQKDLNNYHKNLKNKAKKSLKDYKV